MRLVLLDKNCTRQNGIWGEQRRLEKWFAYLTTLTRKTNWAVVEQHGLVYQWRSSSGPKKERFGVFDQNSRFQKMVLWTNEREQENGSYPWKFALACTKAAWIFGKLAEWEQKLVSCGSFCWIKTAPGRIDFGRTKKTREMVCISDNSH